MTNRSVFLRSQFYNFLQTKFTFNSSTCFRILKDVFFIKRNMFLILKILRIPFFVRTFLLVFPDVPLSFMILVSDMKFCYNSQPNKNIRKKQNDHGRNISYNVNV